MVFDKHEDNENSIPKSNYNWISIPLKFHEFQDCINFNVLMDYDYSINNRFERVKTAVGCRFLNIKQTNPTSLSLHNIALSKNNTKLCSLHYWEDEIGDHGGTFNVTLTPIQQSCEASDCTLNAVYTNKMLALTCEACFERPCFYRNKNSTVTFVIPFVLTNKTYIIQPFRPLNNPNLCIILLAVSLSCLVFLLFITIIYRYTQLESVILSTYN